MRRYADPLSELRERIRPIHVTAINNAISYAKSRLDNAVKYGKSREQSEHCERQVTLLEGIRVVLSALGEPK